MAKHFDIIFEDDYFILVNKAAGILSIPDRYEPDLPNLKATLSRIRDEIFVVHRIDKDTSGLVLFCKSAEMHKELSLLFENREISKKYHAIVQGNMIEDQGTIDSSILVQRDKSKVSISPKGKASTTHYKVLERFKNYNYLELDLATGRRHQIRVHLYSLSCPILADKVYGSTGDFFLSQIKKKRYNLKKFEVERPLLSRQALHAYSLEFTHPITKEKLKFTAEPPKDMRAVLTQLRKLNA